MKSKRYVEVALSLIILSIFFTAFFIQPSQTEESYTSALDPGWLSGWQYRKMHNIVGATGAGTNYQNQIKLYYNAQPFGYEKRDGQFKASDYDSLGNLYVQGCETSAPDKLYKSTDGGKTFFVVYTLPDGGRFRRKVLFIDSQNRIFISAEEFTSGASTRLLRSIDGGQTFSQVLAAPIWDMDEDANGNLYACRYWEATGDGARVYKSTDGGVNWADISSPSWTSGSTRHVHRVRIDPSTGWLYVSIGDFVGSGARSGIWRSKLKDGTDWVRKYGEYSPTSQSVFIGIVFKDNYIYLGDDNESDQGEIYRFQDDGTGNLQSVSDADRVLVIGDGVNRACFYLEEDDTGRIWATFYPYPSPADGRLYTSEDGTTWIYRGTYCRAVSIDDILKFNYMEAGVRHFRGKQESRFSIVGRHIRASFDIQATSLNGHSRTDFGDVRFTSSDGTTLLDYWIEEKVDGDYAIFHVEVSEDLGSDRTIYVYYGKSDATTTSSGSNTFPFFSHFDDLAGFTSESGNGGSVSVSSSILTLSLATQQYSSARVYTTTQFAINYAMRARVNFPTAALQYYRLFAWSNLDGTSPHWKVVVSSELGSLETFDTTHQVRNRHLSSENKVTTTWSTGTYKIFEMQRTSAKTIGSEEGGSAIENTGQVPTGSLSGCLAHESYIPTTASNLFADWFLIRKFVDPEPMHGVWGSEELVYYLTLATSPSGVAKPVGEGWYEAGTYASLSTNDYVYTAADTRYRFNGWTTTDINEITNSSAASTTVLMDKSKTVTANYVTQYYLMVTSPYDTPGGQGWYDSGSSAYATLANGTVSGGTGIRYVFTGWSGDASGTGLESNAITMNGPKTAVANWKTQYYITVTSAHGSPTSSGWVDAGSSFTASVTSPTEIVSNDHQWVCTGFSVDRGAYQTGTTYTFTNVQVAHSIDFAWITQYYLTMSTNFGVVSPSSKWYDAATKINILVTPPDAKSNERYAWNGWTGTGNGSYTGMDNPASITMNQPINETASWKLQFLVVFQQTGVPEGSIAHVVVNSVQHELPYSEWFDQGSTVNFAYEETVPGATPILYGHIQRHILTATSEQSPLTVEAPITVTGDYTTQYTTELIALISAIVILGALTTAIILLRRKKSKFSHNP